MLGIVKMQAVSVANSVNSEDRATAALLANDLISELWANQSATAPSDYRTWQTRVTSTLRNGVGTLSVAGGSPVVATVTIQWTRQLGRNIDIGNSASSDPDKTATYTTQVIIAQN